MKRYNLSVCVFRHRLSVGWDSCYARHSGVPPDDRCAVVKCDFVWHTSFSWLRCKCKSFILIDKHYATNIQNKCAFCNNRAILTLQGGSKSRIIRTTLKAYCPHSSSNLMASTYWAMPTATSLAAFMASTTVCGRCTTSPPANTPRRVVMPLGRSPTIT